MSWDAELTEGIAGLMFTRPEPRADAPNASSGSMLGRSARG
ncbi:hypothetical protein [Nonomuraea sp. NEAU-A123]|nr:hypothetical protein [Nonomuraea sp. NEAU-A123]